MEGGRTTKGPRKIDYAYYALLCLRDGCRKEKEKEQCWEERHERKAVCVCVVEQRGGMEGRLCVYVLWNKQEGREVARDVCWITGRGGILESVMVVRRPGLLVGGLIVRFFDVCVCCTRLHSAVGCRVSGVNEFKHQEHHNASVELSLSRYDDGKDRQTKKLKRSRRVLCVPDM